MMDMRQHKLFKSSIYCGGLLPGWNGAHTTGCPSCMSPKCICVCADIRACTSYIHTHRIDYLDVMRRIFDGFGEFNSFCARCYFFKDTAFCSLCAPILFRHLTVVTVATGVYLCDICSKQQCG